MANQIAEFADGTLVPRFLTAGWLFLIIAFAVYDPCASAALTEPTHPWSLAVVWGPALRFRVSLPRGRSALIPWAPRCFLGRDSFFGWSHSVFFRPRVLAPYLPLSFLLPDPPGRLGLQRQFERFQRQERAKENGWSWPKCLPIPGLAVTTGGLQIRGCRRVSAPAAVSSMPI